MARVVFFSFDYDDVWRVNQVRNTGAFVGEQRAGFRDKAEYEQVKRRGDNAIKQWIRKQMLGCSVTCVLIGAATHRIVSPPRIGGSAMARGRGIRVSEIVDRSIRGIRDAQREYEKWSSFALWAAPEYWWLQALQGRYMGLAALASSRWRKT